MRSAIPPAKTRKHRAYSCSKAAKLMHAAYCCASAQTPIDETTCSSTEPIQYWKCGKLPPMVLQATGAVVCDYRSLKATFARARSSNHQGFSTLNSDESSVFSTAASCENAVAPCYIQKITLNFKLGLLFYRQLYNR